MTSELEPDTGSASPSSVDPPKAAAPRPSGARFVAFGIMSSKIFGLLREMAYSRFLGVGPHTDVLRQAFKAPNLLQNLLGEQTLSAAFIPIYSRMLEEGREEDAGRFAGAVFGLLVLVVATLVTLGIVFAPWIVAVLSPGFLGDAEAVAAGTKEIDRYALLVKVVRLVFPMTGFMVLAAWTMGILNSHRRFVLPYMAPAFWNICLLSGLFAAAAQRGKLWTPAGADSDDATALLYGICFGAVVGGLMQFLVQLPLVLKLSRGLRVSISTRIDGVRDSFKALGPALAGRGVVQFSLYIDMILASFLAAGAPSAINFASTLINLPLGVFGMSVAAAELPELSRQGPEQARHAMAQRIRAAMKQSSFLILPSVVGYLCFGYLVVSLLYRGGQFGVASIWLVWAVLGCYALGLPASTLSRLMQNSFFALRDTRTPALIAIVRLVASATLGLFWMLHLDTQSVASFMQRLSGFPMLETDLTTGQELFMGACGLAAAAGVGSWAELALLIWCLKRRLPELRLPLGRIVVFASASVAAAVPCVVLWFQLRNQHHAVQSLAVLGTFAVLYLAAAWLTRAPELDMWLGRLQRRRSS